jgi:phosphate transport system substrate-binding protein
LRSKTLKFASVALAAGLVLTACGDDEDDPETGTDTTEAADGGETGEVGASEGSVFISGSSTVEPISSLVADLFNEAGSPAQIDVEGPGTGDGFELFCNGESDISDASRPIQQEEVDACDANGIEFIEIEVAFDGISVLTSANNDAVECVTTEDLYALLGPESEGFSNWSDAQEIASALGSSTELPDAPLDITGPGTESGTYDAFAELALGGPSEARAESGDITEEQVETIRSDYASNSDDNAIIAGIESSDTSLGWVGFAFAEGAGDSVLEIPVDGGEGCIEPSIETIADGSYPLSRSLFIYVSVPSLEENPALEEYVDFYLQDTQLNEGVLEAGYVPLPEDRAAAAVERWESRTTGSALL